MGWPPNEFDGNTRWPAILAVGAWIVNLAIIAAFLYVVAHFVRKFW